MNSYFANTSLDYIYKANFEVFKKHFGGILIVKKIKQGEFRIVFTTEFGNKLFDFELKNGDIEIKYIVEALNNEQAINMICDDFKTLLFESAEIDGQYDNDIDYILKSNTNEIQTYYVVSKDSKVLKKILRTVKNKEKLSIEFKEIENGIANSILINHNKFNTRLNLSYIGLQ